MDAIVYLLIAAFGAFLIIRHLRKKKIYPAVTTGVICGYKKETGESTNDGDTTTSVSSYPEVDYTVNGVKLHGVYRVQNALAKYKAGDSVEIRYDPTTPDKFIIAGDKSLLIMGLMFGLAGLAGVIISIFRLA